MLNRTENTAREETKEYANLHFKFIKAYKQSGEGIINSMSSYWYTVSRPDSIRFSQGTALEELLAKYSLYRLPMDYSSDSGKYEIEAKYATEFLNALISLKNERGSAFTLGRNELHQLISELQKSAYLNIEQAQYYLKEIPVELTLEERRKLAEKNHDFNEAIALANIYKNDKESLFSTNSAIYWLTKAMEFKPNNVELAQVINLDDFFHSFNYLDYPYIFNKSMQPLLDALKKNNSIIKVSFGVFFSPDCINECLAEYLTQTQTLKTLDISTTWSQDSYNRLRAKDMQFIAHGLKFNSSLEELDVSDQPIGDEGVIILLNALASNPNTKLKTLNLFCTGMTEKGQKALEEFLQTNKTLEWVNVRENRGVTSAIINSLTERNTIAHQIQQQEKLIQEPFAELKKMVQHYSLEVAKVRHGVFAGQLPRNLREITMELDKISSGECTMKQGLNNIISIAGKMDNNHPILKAANQCNDLITIDISESKHAAVRFGK